jgi:uncharacterized GH25 family protein
MARLVKWLSESYFIQKGLELAGKQEGPMKKTSAILLAIFIIISVAAVSLGHDFWLVPQKFLLKLGETQTISANTGMDFPISVHAVKSERVTQFISVRDGKKRNITEYEIQGESLATKLTFEESGTYILAIALKPTPKVNLSAKEVNDYLLSDEGDKKLYEFRKKEGRLDEDVVYCYSKDAKTIIQVGDSPDETPVKPLNLSLEIVPSVNPYKLKKGNDLKITVLFKGKPLARAELNWSWAGHGETFAGITETDLEGTATVPLTKAGPYVIRMIHTQLIKADEWQGYWSSLTFEVLPE